MRGSKDDEWEPQRVGIIVVTVLQRFLTKVDLLLSFGSYEIFFYLSTLSIIGNYLYIIWNSRNDIDEVLLSQELKVFFLCFLKYMKFHLFISSKVLITVYNLFFVKIYNIYLFIIYIILVLTENFFFFLVKPGIFVITKDQISDIFN